MTSFEQQALSTSLIKPTCWCRKVDDTFVILPHDNDPSQLLQHLNQHHPRIQFTVETENNSQLPFLDVLVTRNTDNTIQTSVYRKPTHTDQYLHCDSNHPLRTKTGVISTLTRRAVKFSSLPPKPELNHLRHVFTKLNNYPIKLVDRIINSTINPTPKPKTTKSDSAPVRISLPYIDKTSHHISRLLKQQAAIDTYFTTATPIKTIIRANGRKHPTTKQEPKGVVYNISCNCGSNYIGETPRPLNIRIKEHKTSTNKADQKSAISEHYQIS
ncbi:uncharacterized protein [Haliotis asinina]|uniref:uncharacterized protein n=1 Tax=Haliotis asinina TaxID=109174 RepID=UPI0035321E88